MNESPRALALLAQVTRGLLRHGADHTARHLGDRSAYVGLSDVGKAITCLRSAVAGKLTRNPFPSGDDLGRWLQGGAGQRITDALGRQLILQRGHWLEAGVESALRANGVTLISQLEIRDSAATVPLLAHLDFTLVAGGSSPVVRVLEIKSTETLPKTLSSAYEAQLYGQIGLLHAHWDHPVFSVKDDQGKQLLQNRTFPQLCHHLFGLTLPASPAKIDIEGWLLCLSMAEARAFGPYRPDAGMLSLCRRTAETLWGTVEAIKAGKSSLDRVNFCSGFHPLCAWCDHAEDCPKFQADPVRDPALDQALAELTRLKADKAVLETDIENREARIRQFCRLAGKDWLATPHFRFRTSRIAGRKTLDPAKLRAELTPRLGEMDTDALLTHAANEGAAYERLTVSAIQTPQTSTPIPG